MGTVQEGGMVKHREALEKLWKGKCTVIVREQAQDPETKITGFTEKELYSNLPCRLSYTTSMSPTSGDDAPALSQSTTLFLGNEWDIPAGSKVIVTQHGRTGEYSQSGEPRYHSDHQEIDLVLFERWA